MAKSSKEIEREREMILASASQGKWVRIPLEPSAFFRCLVSGVWFHEGVYKTQLLRLSR